MTLHLLFARIAATRYWTHERVFVNLPVTDLERAQAFYTAIGFTINPLFTDCRAVAGTSSRASRACSAWRPDALIRDRSAARWRIGCGDRRAMKRVDPHAV